MKALPYLFALLLLLPFAPVTAQDTTENAKPRIMPADPVDNRHNAFLIYVNIGAATPGGQMKIRFGAWGQAGAGFMYKSKTDFLFATDFTYMFGARVNEDPLKSLTTTSGGIIGGTGDPVDIRYQMRGYKLPFLKVGKVLIHTRHPKLDESSGFYAMAGAGYLTHFIYYNDPSNTVYQLMEPYRKGYDRLTSGFALNQTLGYLLLSKNKRVSGFINVDVTQGFTYSRRYDFDLQRHNASRRSDISYAFSLGIIFPVYGKRPNEYYYY